MSDPPSTAPPPAGALPTCEICGRPPAIFIHASKYSGRVLFGDEIFWKGDACRQCALCQYRAGLTHCLWAGWWSPISLVVNPRMIHRNASGLRQARKLPEPQGEALAEPLDPGRPLLRRPAALVGLVLPILLIAGVVALVVALTGGGVRLDQVAVGDCIDLPEGDRIESVEIVGCEFAHDAEVTGIVSGSSPGEFENLCQKQTETFLGGTDPVAGLTPSGIRFNHGTLRVICLVSSDDESGYLVGSKRGAAR